MENSESTTEDTSRIKALDKASIHRISSGQVVIDLQTAVKELVENSLDAGATSIEVRFKQYGVTSVEVIDNGCGIAEKDWESVGLKYYTSKLATFDDLSTLRSFGFRGEALSSLCALCDNVTVITATSGPMGIQLDLEHSGKVAKKTKVARQRGTTVQFTGLFAQLPVRRKELQRNMKREFGKALGLLNAYALGPCAGMDGSGRGTRLTVSNQQENGKKIDQIKTNGTSSFKASLTALWGPKAMENMVELNLSFRFQQEKSALRRIRDRHAEPGSQTQGPCDDDNNDDTIPIQVKGLISKFSVGAGRTGTDRQFFYVNGRPCNLTKVQKGFNEVYRTFNANQAPFVLADFIVPTECCDINVSPDKRTIFLQSEGKLIDALKVALETEFSSHRSTFDLNPTPMSQRALTQTTFDSPFSKRLNLKAGSGLIKSQSLPTPTSSKDKEKAPPPGSVAGEPLFLPEPVADEVGGAQAAPAVAITEEADTQEERRTPANDKSQLLPIPATSEDNEKLPEPERTAGEKLSRPKPLPVPNEVDAAQASPAGPEKSRMDKAETEGEARKPAEDTDAGDKSRPMEKLDHMDVDEGERPERSKEKQIEKPVVLDTTQAAWGRKKTAPVPEKESDDLPEPGGASEEPATKKRRVEVEDAQTDASTSASKPARKPPSKSGAGMTSLDSLRNRLAGFARGGLLASSKKEPPARDEEMDAEDMEGVEKVRTPGKDVRKGRDRRPSFEIIGPRIKTIVLREEQRPVGGVDKTRARSDSDTVMEDAIPSMSSTTAPPERHPASKVIEMDDEQDLASETSTKQSGQRPEIIRGSDTASGNVTLRFDIERLTSAWTRLRNQVVGAEGAPCVSSKVSADAGVANTEDNESATRALARVIDKADFANMDIIGQFNLGFIIVRRQKAAACDDGGERDQMDDLFIVDQHASDEKYNFETLQQTTRIQSQKLFRPRPLELTAADELVAIENMHMLQQNGFELAVDETAAVGQGSKLKVTAFPVSKSTEFGMADLEELLNLMRDQPSGNVVRCSKARAMFAMRACRKSVMIGMPLNKSQMTTVVQHMGTIEQPWNCPHGRPTMRHLFDLCQDDPRRKPRTVIWSSLEGM